MELRWTFAHEGEKYKVVLVDFAGDIFNTIYDPGFQSSDLGIILQASYFLNDNYWHPALNEKQVAVLGEIKKVSQNIIQEYAAALKMSCSEKKGFDKN